MRYFQVEGGDRTLGVEPLRIVAERVGQGNLDDPIGLRPDDHVTEAELLALDGGRQALDLWRAGDDSAHAAAIQSELEAGAFDDELVAAGRAARPDLVDRHHAAMRATPIEWDKAERILNEIRKAGAEALGQ